MRIGGGSVKRPLIPTAISFAVGTGIGLSHCSSAAVAFFCALAAAAAVAALFSRRLRLPAALLAVFGIGALRAALASLPTVAAERDFAALYESDRQVTVRGEIAAVLRSDITGGGDIRHVFLLKDASFRLRGAPRRLRSPVRVEWYAAPPEKGGRTPARGNLLEAVGVVHARRAVGEGGATAGDVCLVTGETRTRFLARAVRDDGIARFRQNAARTLSRGLDDMPEERDLVLAMTLGMRSSLSQRMKDAFRKAGTIHVFAISGLHVGAMAVMMVGLLSFLGIPRTFVFVPLAPLLAAYVYMTGLQSSAIRAALMVAIYFFALLIDRKPNAFDSVAAALLLVTLANPFAVSEISLIMSFSMVTGILLFTGSITVLCRRATGCRNLALERQLVLLSERNGDPYARVYRWPRDLLIRMWLGFISVFAAALGASLVSFPLTAHFFGMLVPYSLLANIIVVPLSLPVMAVAGFGLLVSSAVPGIELATNRIAAWLAWTMRLVSETIAALPHSSFRMEFPIYGLVLWYLALILLLRGIPGLCGPVFRTEADQPEPIFED